MININDEMMALVVQFEKLAFLEELIECGSIKDIWTILKHRSSILLNAKEQTSSLLVSLTEPGRWADTDIIDFLHNLYLIVSSALDNVLADLKRFQEEAASRNLN